MKIGKVIKKFFLFLLVLIVLIVGAAIAIPYFFKDEILARIKTDINQSIEAEVDFREVDLSLLRSFPDFNFRMSDFSITGVNEFEGIQLTAVDELDFSFDVKSVIDKNRPIEVHSVHLKQPKIHIITLKDGKSNYQITKPSEATEEGQAYNFLVQLKEYSIEGGHLIYDDRLGNMHVELEDLDHTGSGDFSQDVFDLATKTNIAKMTTRFDGITYLNKAYGDFDILLNANLKNNTYTLKENELRLNNFLLQADGNFVVGWDEIAMDLQFNAPRKQI